VTGTGTTADGLSYCPPDAGRVGSHVPRGERVNCGKGRRQAIPFGCKLGYGHTGNCSLYTLPPRLPGAANEVTVEYADGTTAALRVPDPAVLDRLRRAVHPIIDAVVAAWSEANAREYPGAD